MKNDGAPCKNLYIWGTGRYGNKASHDYIVFEHIYEYLNISLEYKLCGFFDNDSKKWETIFNNIKIFEPTDEMLADADVIVIAVYDASSVKFGLSARNICRADLWTMNDMLHNLANKCKNAMLLQKLVSEPVFDVETSNVAKAVFVLQNLDKNIESFFGNKAENTKFNVEDILSALYLEYGMNIKTLANTINKHTSVRAHPIKTVGFVIDRMYGGGIEKTVSILLNMFVNHGYKVVLITKEYKPELENDFSPEVLRENRENGNALSFKSNLEEIKSIMEKHSIDLMCFHSGYMNLNTAYEILLCRFMNVFTLMEIHSAFYAFQLLKLDCNQFAEMFNLNDKVVMLSRGDIKEWSEYGAQGVYIPNPVTHNPVDRFISNCDKKILWIGRLVSNPKHVEDIVPIMSKVKNAIPNIKLQVIGYPDNEQVYNELCNSIKENDLEDIIELCGYQADISSFYSGGYILLITSETESYSNVLVEGMAYGLPVVMYDIPWLELLNDGKGVVLVPQRDCNAAADALITLINDRREYDRMSAEAATKYRKLYQYDYMSDWSSQISLIH